MKWPLAVPALTLSAALMLSACTTPATAENVTSISFETGVCYGTCPAFTAQVGSDGVGAYEGNAFVANEGAHDFQVTPAEFAAFESRLAPFRPEASVSYGFDNCDGPVATDNPSVKVTWLDEDGNSVSLDWYMGCRQPMLSEDSDAIYKAWQEISALSELVGTSEQRRGK